MAAVAATEASMQVVLELLAKDLQERVVMLAEVPAAALVVAVVHQLQVLLELQVALAMVVQAALEQRQASLDQA